MFTKGRQIKADLLNPVHNLYMSKSLDFTNFMECYLECKDKQNEEGRAECLY